MRKSEDLRAEYILIQGQYEAFDQRALSLKALATPLLGAGIGLGLKDDSTSLLWATISIASSLWILEAIWKGFQYMLTDRIILLEKWFLGEGLDDCPPFQIYTWWCKAYARERYVYTLKRMVAPFVCLPYAVVIVISLSAVIIR